MPKPAPYRIGAGAGYAGDRIDPARALAERGALDALVFECLAERTIALAQLRRRRDPAGGFDPMLEARLRAVLPACVARGTRILTNMGAANPAGAGAVAIGVARSLGLRLRVAVITGDDVLGWVQANDPELIEGAAAGQRASRLGDRLVSANAYLGADALRPALDAGAMLVIASRVADPALFLAPLAQHFGWREDDWPMLGRGVLAGHLLECAVQVSGGYLADPGRLHVPDLHDVGFPFAEVQADGGFVLQKLPGTGGRIDRLTGTAQLLYEVMDPARYVQPDVVADFRAVRLHEAGPDRLHVSGASGRERPAMLKATLGVREGFVGEGQIGYAGPNARERGRLALRVLERRLDVLGLASLERRTELIGVDSMHGGAHGADREPWEVRARLAVRCPDEGTAAVIAQEVEALYLNGPGGGGGVTGSVREVIGVTSALVPRAAVQPATALLEA